MSPDASNKGRQKMALTTVTTWSENPGDVTAAGLTIGGIQISEAELMDIDSRETALDRGITPDLLELWENQGGKVWSQILDWLYQYADETAKARPDPNHHMHRLVTSQGKPEPKLTRVGPVLVIEANDGEFVATYQLCGNQAGTLTARATSWEIDGDTRSYTWRGSFGEEQRLWSCFLGLLPTDIAVRVHTQVN
jgi:hypothetical protein